MARFNRPATTQRLPDPY